MIGDTTNFTEYVGNGSTVTAYAIPFRYDAAGWVLSPSATRRVM